MSTAAAGGIPRFITAARTGKPPGGRGRRRFGMRLRQPTSRATLIEVGDPGTTAVTLTFDCGSDLGSTTQILDLLRREGITAAFGVTARFAELYPTAVNRMIADGHQLINHGYDHPSFSTLSRQGRTRQLDRTEQIFTALGGPSAGWFRPPYFDRNAAVDTDLAARGYYVGLLASIDALGWRVTPRKTTPQEVVTKPTCIRKLAPGRSLSSTVGRPRSRRVDFRATGVEARRRCASLPCRGDVLDLLHGSAAAWVVVQPSSTRLLPRRVPMLSLVVSPGRQPAWSRVTGLDSVVYSWSLAWSSAPDIGVRTATGGVAFR